MVHESNEFSKRYNKSLQRKAISFFLFLSGTAKKLLLAFVLWLLSVHLVALRYLILSSLFDLVGAFVAYFGGVRVFFQYPHYLFFILYFSLTHMSTYKSWGCGLGSQLAGEERRLGWIDRA
jgi:hypothetical protein